MPWRPAGAALCVPCGQTGFPGAGQRPAVADDRQATPQVMAAVGPEAEVLVEAAGVRVRLAPPQLALGVAATGQSSQRVLYEEPADALSLRRRQEVHGVEFPDTRGLPVGRATERVAQHRSVTLGQPQPVR